MTTSKRLIACVLLCAVAASAGCSSMKTITLAQPAAARLAKVKTGDLVEVHTRDGRRARFIVQQIDAESIVGPGAIRYERAEIVRLQRRSFSVIKTVSLAGGIFAGAFVLWAAAAVAALGEWE